MRRDHPCWGKRRIEYELGRQGCPGPILYRTVVWIRSARRLTACPPINLWPWFGVHCSPQVLDGCLEWERYGYTAIYHPPRTNWGTDVVYSHSVRSCRTLCVTGLGERLRAAQGGQRRQRVDRGNPRTVDAGSIVALRADCGDNSVPATVTSKAFGTVTVQPFVNLLTAEVDVPARTKEGRYDVNLACRSGSTATTSLWVGSTGRRRNRSRDRRRSRAWDPTPAVASSPTVVAAA